MADKEQTGEKSKKVNFEKVVERFSNRTSKKDDKKKLVETEEAEEALDWLSLVDDQHEEPISTNQNKSNTRFQNRTSHRSKKAELPIVLFGSSSYLTVRQWSKGFSM